MASSHARKAEFFDRHAGAFQRRDFSPEEREKLEWLHQQWDLRPGMTVVEPGCGDGRLTKRLVRWVGNTGKVIAFDPSPCMMAAHREAVTAANVERYVGTAEEIDLPDVRAARVICACVFPHFTDKPRALCNLCRMLREGGLLFVAHFLSREELNQYHREIGDVVARDHIPSEDVMRELFENAGMKVEELINRPGLYHLRAVRAQGADVRESRRT